jgi:hypothetical protein
MTYLSWPETSGVSWQPKVSLTTGHSDPLMQPTSAPRMGLRRKRARG